VIAADGDTFLGNDVEDAAPAPTHPCEAPTVGAATRGVIIVKYLLLIYGNEELWESFPEEEFAKVIEETNALQRELRESGEFVGAWGVADQVQAKCVRLVDGVPAVTDGPYIEAKEYLGSIDIIDCASLERALEIAARVLFARVGSVEVRPLMHEAAPEV
jgi:hypothetical protein